MRAVIHCDGASSGNPGPSGIGGVVVFRGKSYEICEPIGTATNNVAEYTSLIRALQRASELGASEAECYMDSELVVKQMRGEYKVKNPGLLPLFKEARTLTNNFRLFQIAHVPREQNKHADRLSKQALESPGPMQDEAPPETSPSQGDLPF